METDYSFTYALMMEDKMAAGVFGRARSIKECVFLQDFGKPCFRRTMIMKYSAKNNNNNIKQYMVEHHEHGKTRNKNDILKEVGHVLCRFQFFYLFSSFFYHFSFATSLPSFALKTVMLQRQVLAYT